MGFCRDCRYWIASQPLDEEVEEETIGLGWGTCEFGLSVAGVPMMLETKAFARDSENYAANLRTRPDFGCVQFDQPAIEPATSNWTAVDAHDSGRLTIELDNPRAMTGSSMDQVDATMIRHEPRPPWFLECSADGLPWPCPKAGLVER